MVLLLHCAIASVRLGLRMEIQQVLRLQASDHPTLISRIAVAGNLLIKNNGEQSNLGYRAWFLSSGVAFLASSKMPRERTYSALTSVLRQSYGVDLLEA